MESDLGQFPEISNGDRIERAPGDNMNEFLSIGAESSAVRSSGFLNVKNGFRD